MNRFLAYLSTIKSELPNTGAFSNEFLEGMKQLYELEPFIKVKPYLINQWEKSNIRIKILRSLHNHEFLSSFLPSLKK